MEHTPLRIIKRTANEAEEGYKIFSIRVKAPVVQALDLLAQQSNRSRNELVNLMLEHGLQNCVVIEKE